MWGEPDKDEDENEQHEAEAGEEVTPGPPTQGTARSQRPMARSQRPSRAAKGTAARRGKRTSGEGVAGARKERRTSTGSDA